MPDIDDLIDQAIDAYQQTEHTEDSRTIDLLIQIVRALHEENRNTRRALAEVRAKAWQE